MLFLLSVLKKSEHGWLLMNGIGASGIVPIFEDAALVNEYEKLWFSEHPIFNGDSRSVRYDRRLASSWTSS